MLPTLFLIIALITGFTTIGILLARSMRLRTDRWLLGIVLVFMGAVCHNLLLEVRVYERNPSLYFLPVIAQLFVGPLFWFYARGMMGREPMPLLQRCVHLVPGAFQLAVQVWAFQLDDERKYQFWSEAYEPWIQPTIFWAGQVSMVAYLLVLHRALVGWRGAMEGQFSNLDPVALRWLDRLVLMFGALVLVSITLGMVPNSFSAAVLPTDVLKTVIVCAIGWQGLRQARIVQAQQVVAVPNIPSEVSVIPGEEEKPIVVQPVEPVPATKPSFAPLILVRIEEAMQQQALYTRPDLNLTDVAAAVGLPAKVVSATINAGKQMTFLSFVNGYRVREVMRALQAGEQRSKSLLGIALEAGFNSKTTFNRVFREQEGVTPSAWMERLPKAEAGAG
jgi:AraC-like DNA-binding protein